jgi:hypothetical protein
MSGSGEIGEIRPGWNVSEFATPVTIGETNGGTGSVNLSAGKKPTSLLIVNNNIFTEDDELGSISGVVNTVNDQGAAVSLTHSTLLSDFNIEKNIPELSAGSPFTALDLCTQLVGQNRLRSDLRGWFGSLAGHSVLFDASGGRVFGDTYYATYEFYNNSTGKFEKQIVSSATDSVFADDFEYISNGILYANGVDGESFTPDPSIENTFHVAFKTPNLNSPMVWSFRGLPSSSGSDLGFTASVSLYDTGGLKYLNVMFDYWSGGLRTIEEETVEVPASSSDEFYVFVKYSYEPSDADSNAFSLYASVQPSDNIDTLTGYTTASASISLFNRPTWYEKWNISGYVRSVWSYDELFKSGEPVLKKILRTNFVSNPSFETNYFDNYSSGASTAIPLGAGAIEYVPVSESQTSSKKYLGQYSFKLTPSQDCQKVYTTYLGNNIPVTPGKKYSFSVYGLEEDGFRDKKISINARFKDSNNQEIFGDSPENISEPSLSTTNWVRATRTITAPINAVYLGSIYINIYTVNQTINTNMTSYIDAIQVEESSLPTSYFDGTFTLENREYVFEEFGPGFPAIVSREYQSSLDAPDIPFRYDSEINILKESTNVLGGPAIGFNGNMWEYLQNACAAYNQEIALVNSVITLRDVGVNEIDLTNVVASPAITPSSTFAGKAVDIVYTNAKKVFDAEVYDAYDDDNRIITVKSKEVVQLTVAANAYVSSVLPPLRKFSLPNADGYYIVSDNTGTPVGGTSANTAWEDYGGKVEVSINPDVPGSIDIKVTGPIQEIPAYPGPYKLAYSDGSNDYAAFSVTGRGITNDSKTLSLQTAADRTKTKQDVAKTVNNPFIDTLEMAYDRGVWASAEAAGPRVSLSGTVPNNAINGFGFAAGSLIKYNDSQYRVTDANINNIGVSFNAVRHVTVEEFDAFWDGKTVSYHDGVWYGFDSQDQIIIPFYGQNITNGYIGFDTDSNPYIKITGTGDGEAELLFDSELNQTNLITNPSFESNITDWTWNSATLQSGTTFSQAFSGTRSMVVTSNGGANFGMFSILLSATAGNTYTGSIYVRDKDTALPYRVGFEWWTATSGGSQISVSTGADTSVTSSGWTRVSFTATAPVGTNAIRFTIFSNGSPTSGQQAYFDAAMLEESDELREYFDGNTPQESGIIGWNGTPNLSTSFKNTYAAPYYKVLDGSNTATLLELDVDFTPYYV